MNEAEVKAAGRAGGKVLRVARTGEVPKINRTLLGLFARYSEYYLRRHFRAVYLSGPKPRFDTNAPTVIYLNHPSWWDPLVCLLLARRFAAERNSYAPIDAKSLEQFRFFRKLGFFGVEQESRRGASDFLNTSAAILRQSRALLWVTPQGEFVDARVRPTKLKSGVAHLATLAPHVQFVPLALEYFFTGERLPAVAVSFGAALEAKSLPTYSHEDCASELAIALEFTQDALAREITSKRIIGAESLLAGARGTGGIYGFWQKVRSRRPG